MKAPGFLITRTDGTTFLSTAEQKHEQRSIRIVTPLYSLVQFEKVLREGGWHDAAALVRAAAEAQL